MSTTDQLLENNRRFAAGFENGGLAAPPSKKIAIVACMDARLDPAAMLGLEPGDAHVIRNAGGVISDEEIRSLAISQRLLGTEEVMLIHHTGCGMLSFTDDEFAAQLEQETGERPAWPGRAFHDIEADVRESIARIEASPFIAHKESVRGFVYDTDTGRLSEVA